MAKKAMKKSASASSGARGSKSAVPAPAKRAAAVARSSSSTRPAAAAAAATPRVAREGKSARVKNATRAIDARRPDRSATRAEPQPPMPPVIIPRPVPTDGKPRKNQAGLTSRELEHFRELLLAKRRELVGDMSSMEREALRSTTGTNLSNLPLHMADMGTDNYEQEFTLGLVEKDRQLLREINRALAKIMDGTYGICEGTAKPITKARLEAQPWAKYSIDYARQMERGMIRR